MKTVLILLDSLNRRHLKTYNLQAPAITPCIDHFSLDCAVYDNHFIGSAPCMPARRDIFTGRTHFLERGWGGIEPFDITLPSELRKNGIFTHISTDHGHYFEIGGENYCDLFNTWDFLRGQELDTWVSKVDGIKPEGEHYGKWSTQYELNKTRFKTEADYSTPQTFASACDWVQNNKGCDDFFLMVEGFDPHEPFDCPKEYLELYNDNYNGPEFNWSTYAPVTEPPEAIKHLENTYMATLSMTDKWFGKLINTLKENNMYDDTLILFTSDHGHMLGEHGFTGKNYMPAYNELSHIPMMIHFPNGQYRGQRVEELTQNIDIMPTVLEHHKCPIPKTVKGLDLEKLLLGQSSRDQVLYGWFGRAVNICDGTYTYFCSPVREDNQPCYQYCAIPSTYGKYYGEDYAETMKMGRFLSYTRYPVYQIPAVENRDFNGIHYVIKPLIFNIKQDYLQQNPITDEALTKVMRKKLLTAMEEAEAPDEQYIRLGLHRQNDE